jgi:hypothetical protein
MLQRMVGVFVAPISTFTSLRAAPRWLDVLTISFLLVTVSTFVFASSDVGARLTVERQVVFAEAAERRVSVDQYAASIAREQREAPMTAAIAGAWLIACTLMVACGALALAQIVTVYMAPPVPAFETFKPTTELSTNNSHQKLRLPDSPDSPDSRHPCKPYETREPGTQATRDPRNQPDAGAAGDTRDARAPTFNHAMCIASHVALIPALATPCRFLLNVWSGSVGPATSVGVLVPFLPHDTIWAHLGNSIDLFGLWGAHTLAVGFAVIYLRRPEGLRMLFMGIYLVGGVLQAAARSFVGAPSF